MIPHHHTSGIGDTKRELDERITSYQNEVKRCRALGMMTPAWVMAGLYRLIGMAVQDPFSTDFYQLMDEKRLVGNNWHPQALRRALQMHMELNNHPQAAAILAKLWEQGDPINEQS